MLNRTYKVALTAVLTVVMVVAFAGVALAAPPWTDISPSVLSPYSITEAQLAQISEGFVDGSWGPYKEMPRKQFVKMAVAAFDIDLVNPATASFPDVPTTDFYYQYIEAATGANLIEGFENGTFGPNSIITREQAAAIIVRWVAAENGFNLATFYTDAEAAAIIAPFNDDGQVGPSLVNEMAFAVDFKIVLGTTSNNLEPKRNLLRIQGAAMLIRSEIGEAPGTEPVATTINLVQSSYPANDPTTAAVLNPIDGGVGVDHTVTATVKDQFGATMDATVTFNWTVTTGNPSQSRIAEGTAGPAGSGKSMDNWAGPGTNIAFNITATADGVTSNTLVKKWATRVLTTATLLPAAGVGMEDIDHTVTVTLKDQFGAPVVDRSVTFTYKLMVEETDVSVTASHDATTSATITTPPTAGQYMDEWDGEGADDVPHWGPATVVVTVQGAPSLTQTATIYFAEDEALTYPTVVGGSGLAIPVGLQPASGTGVPADVLWSVTQAPPFMTWPVVGSGPYISGSGSTILTSRFWVGDELVFVHFPSSTNVDGFPNWLFSLGAG